MSSVGWASVFSLTLLAACGTRASGGFDPDGGTGGGPPSGPGDDASLGTGGGGPGSDAGACPNVDILFVIDNSGSMADKPTRLASSCPGFGTAIVNRLPSAKSVHVGVVSTSEYYAGAPQACLVRRTEGPLSSGRTCLSTPFMASADPGFKDTFACNAQLG